MRLDLVRCDVCGGRCFFGDEVCEACMGHGAVPLDLDEPSECCRCCGQPVNAENCDSTGVCLSCNEPEEPLCPICSMPTGGGYCDAHLPVLGVECSNPSAWTPPRDIIPF